MPGAGELQEYRRHAEWAIVAATAYEMGIIEALAEGPRSAPQLAAGLALSERGARTMLGALEELGIVGRRDDAFSLEPEARDLFVDRESAHFHGDSLRLWLDNVRQWANHLPHAVRSGTPQRGAERPDPAADPEALRRFMAAMDNKPPAQVARVVEAALARAPHARSMLDLGGGPGTFARAFAARGLRATLFDRPEVIQHVQTAYGLDADPRVSTVEGDFLEAMPEVRYDVVLLANITHIFDEDTNARLIRRAAALLEPDGALAILDFVRGRGEFASLFAVTMLLNTDEGSTYGEDDYRGWLETAGCREVEATAIDADRTLITARR